MTRSDKLAALYEGSFKKAVSALEEHDIHVQRPTTVRFKASGRGEDSEAKGGANYKPAPDILTVYFAPKRTLKRLQVTIEHELLHKWQTDANHRPPKGFEQRMQRIGGVITNDLPRFAENWDYFEFEPRLPLSSRSNAIYAAEIIVAGGEIISALRENQRTLQRLGKAEKREWMQEHVLKHHSRELNDLLRPVITRFDRVNGGLSRLMGSLGEAMTFFWQFYRYDTFDLAARGKQKNMDLDAPEIVRDYFKWWVSDLSYPPAVNEFFMNMYKYYQRQRKKKSQKDAVIETMERAKRAFNEERRKAER